MSSIGTIRDKLNKSLRGAASKFELRESNGAVVIEGEADSWQTVVKAGETAARSGFRGVVNKLSVPELAERPMLMPDLHDCALEGREPDVLIIGGGVIGCFIARELSRLALDILLVDKEADVAMHTSSRNDGMIHPGFAVRPHTKKAYYNVRGNKMYDGVTRDLSLDFRRTGLLIVTGMKHAHLIYTVLKTLSRINGVRDYRVIEEKELRSLEPHLNPDLNSGMLFPTAGILSPYKLTVALAEHAAENGAEISLETVVSHIRTRNGSIESVVTNRGTLRPRVVVNAAGNWADVIADMAGDQFFTIHPRKGQAVIMDKKCGSLANHILAELNPGLFRSDTKGGGIIKCIDGNLLVGPDAEEVPYREDYSTDRSSIDSVLTRHLPIIPSLSREDAITYYAGIRAATYEEDFIVEPSSKISNLVHAAGIQSPGLACAPAIAEDAAAMVRSILEKQMEVKPRTGWIPIRRGIPPVCSMSSFERSEYIRRRPDYGIIVCRCEGISRGEITDAIRSPVPVYTVDGIKRRVRAGMGRCQGGFCLPQVLKILQEEAGLDPLSITKKGRHSNILTDETKQEVLHNGDA